MEIIKQDKTLYRKYPGQTQAQDAYIEIDYESPVMLADYNSEIGNAVPMHVYNGRMTRIGVGNLLTPDRVNEIMKSIEPLADRIVAGYARVGAYGILNKDASDALVEAECIVDDMVEASSAAEMYTVVESWDEWLEDWKPACGRAHESHSLSDFHDMIMASADDMDAPVLFTVGEDELARYLEAELLDGRHPMMNEFNFQKYPKWIRQLPRVASQILDYLHLADNQIDAVAYYMNDCDPDESRPDTLDDFVDSVGWVVRRGFLDGSDPRDLIAVQDEDGNPVVIYVADDCYPVRDIRRYGMKEVEGKQ